MLVVLLHMLDVVAQIVGLGFHVVSRDRALLRGAVVVTSLIVGQGGAKAAQNGDHGQGKNGLHEMSPMLSNGGCLS